MAVGGGADICYAGAAMNRIAIDLSGLTRVCPFFEDATGDPVVLPLI